MRVHLYPAPLTSRARGLRRPAADQLDVDTMDIVDAYVYVANLTEANLVYRFRSRAVKQEEARADV